MVSGPTTIALSLLFSPATFAAALDRFDLLGEQAPGIRPRHCAHLALFALGAYLLSALGPIIAVSLLPVLEGRPSETAPEAQSVVALARLLIPFVIAVFAIVSGLAGALVGHVTRRWGPGRRSALRWFACLALIVSFWLPFLITSNLIVNRGVPAAWIIMGPLALPCILTAVVAWRERGSLGILFRFRSDRAGTSSVHPEFLDQVISAVAEADGQEESRIEALAHTEPELEMAHLVAGIRRVAAPSATISESRVQEIVRAMVAASPATAAKRSAVRRPTAALASVGEFCSSWACLAAGLLIVSPLGGVPPSVVSAGAVGFLGSAGIIFLARLSEAESTTVLT